MDATLRNSSATLQPALPGKSPSLSPAGTRVRPPETRHCGAAGILGQQLDGGDLAVRRRRADDRPTIGTKLCREHQGVLHQVTVLQDGYEWEGRPYQSLSAIARTITGTRWNGLVFFGLKNRRADK